MATKKPVEKSTLRAELNTTLGKDLLDKAARRLEDRPRMLRMIADFGQEWEREVFATEGAVAGRRWKPLAASTPGKTLVRTGALKNMLTGAPRQMKASVQLRAPDYAQHLRAGRYGPKSKVASGRRQGVEGLGGSMPRRNPSPHPPRDRLAILTSDLLGFVTPEDRS
ncbi:hypothetical protein [Microbacterium sp. KNMS]